VPARLLRIYAQSERVESKALAVGVLGAMLARYPGYRPEVEEILFSVASEPFKQGSVHPQTALDALVQAGEAGIPLLRRLHEEQAVQGEGARVYLRELARRGFRPDDTPANRTCALYSGGGDRRRALGMAIVEAVAQDAGFGPHAAQPPLGSELVLDRQSFLAGFHQHFGSQAAAGFEQALLAQGYRFAHAFDLIRSNPDSIAAGVKYYWVAGEQVAATLDDLALDGDVVIARITYYYTYRPAAGGSTVCPRTLEVRLKRVASQWQAIETNVVAQC
jgi:hypothetical protein